jgi:hypothetical protein
MSYPLSCHCREHAGPRVSMSSGSRRCNHASPGVRRSRVCDGNGTGVHGNREPAWQRESIQH